MAANQVLFVSRYSLTDEKTGELIRGCKVTYMDNYFVTDERNKGHAVLTCSAPYEMFSIFDKLPGKYNLEFRQRPDPKGKPILSIVQATYVP